MFAERLKRSGMTWGREGGQVIVDLRILGLSGVWQQAHEAYLASRPQPTIAKQASKGQGQDQNSDHDVPVPRSLYSGASPPSCHLPVSAV